MFFMQPEKHWAGAQIVSGSNLDSSKARLSHSEHHRLVRPTCLHVLGSKSSFVNGDQGMVVIGCQGVAFQL